MPWKADGSYEDLVEAIHVTASRVQAAKHIVVAGGGATGVEVCGELRYEFPDKEVVLLSADETLVRGDQTAAPLERALTSMGVVVRKGVKAVATSTGADSKTDVTLSNGETLTTDLYLPTVGIVPNSECVPEALLDEKGLVRVDDCMRVIGADNVWAAGDVVGKPTPGYLVTEAQVRTCSFFLCLPANKNILVRLCGQEHCQSHLWKRAGAPRRNYGCLRLRDWSLQRCRPLPLDATPFHSCMGCQIAYSWG